MQHGRTHAPAHQLQHLASGLGRCGLNRDRESRVHCNLSLHTGGQARRAKPAESEQGRDDKGRARGEAILTAIDKSVVILLVGLGAVAFAGEEDSCGALRLALGVVGEGDLFDWADSGDEEVLGGS